MQVDRAQHIIETAQRDAERRVPSVRNTGTYGLVTKVAQLTSECGSLAAHIRVLCAEIADLQARLDPPAERAGQFAATVECDQCTAHVVWQYEDGERGIHDVRLIGNAVLELGWLSDDTTPEYVVKAMDAAEMAADLLES
jgi:hypothetical protein